MDYYQEAQFGMLYEAYCDYIMDNTIHTIANGDDLVQAVERGHLLDEFVLDYQAKKPWVTTSK